jgi:hypothetical protein
LYSQNAVQAQHIYQEQFPNRRIPNMRTIVRIVQHLRDNGSYTDRGVQRPHRVAGRYGARYFEQW